ncbi:putative transcription factor FAR family [Medicago truncatula]|uniref:Putative transcription factor FAR family n=1 Tax=Medicago truncatula TaxID=3880 RepID=A0A396JU01_MEDTR|nr:putative transcription factor FAR family [Medicago truncatula]
MDIDEILSIFQERDHTAIGGSESEGSSNRSLSESDGCSPGEDFEETNEEGVGCNFKDETAVDSVTDLEKINFKETSIENLMRYHFPDREVAFMFYNWYGCFHGFAARKSRLIRNINGEVVQQTFLCHREGIREEKYINSTSRKREHKPLSRCGCQAKVRVHIDVSSQRWYIKLFDDDHNHSFVKEKFERMLPAHRKMSEYDKYQMNTMRQSGISTTRIHGYFASQAGGYQNVGYNRRDMYNEQRKRRMRWNSDAEQAVNFLKHMSSKDDMMFWRHTVHADGSLQHLFWCDGVSCMDYSIFGDVLAFDATYKKIKYNTPLVIFSGVNHHNQSIIFGSAIIGDETEDTYVWLLKIFVEAMGGKLPVSVITDGDLSMRNAIRKVFPEAHHRLCAWHLIRNATSNIKNLHFVSKFKDCLLGDVDVDVFQRKWEELVTEFGLEENPWMLEMYQKRKMWAAAHFRGKFFAGFRTTSRCEGLHSEFGKYVSALTNLHDFFQQFFRWLNYMRYREIEADFSSSHGDIVVQTQHHHLERSAFKLYTKTIFRLFRKVLERACRFDVHIVSQNGSIHNHIVRRYPRQDIEWTVSYCEHRLVFECTCKRLETLGIACEHVMCVVKFLGIVNLPGIACEQCFSPCNICHFWFSPL